VSEQEAAAFAGRHGLTYVEASARSGDGVRDVFARLTMAILEKVRTGELQEIAPVQTAPPVSRPANPVKEAGCAC
jgi:hypothetical protein